MWRPCLFLLASEREREQQEGRKRRAGTGKQLGDIGFDRRLGFFARTWGRSMTTVNRTMHDPWCSMLVDELERGDLSR